MRKLNGYLGYRPSSDSVLIHLGNGCAQSRLTPRLPARPYIAFYESIDHLVDRQLPVPVFDQDAFVDAPDAPGF